MKAGQRTGNQIKNPNTILSIRIPELSAKDQRKQIQIPWTTTSIPIAERRIKKRTIRRRTTGKPKIPLPIQVIVPKLKPENRREQDPIPWTSITSQSPSAGQKRTVRRRIMGKPKHIFTPHSSCNPRANLQEREKASFQSREQFTSQTKTPAAIGRRPT